MKLSPIFISVTPLSKFLALFLFILFNIIGFNFGRYYQHRFQIQQSNQTTSTQPQTSSKPSDDISNWNTYTDKKLGFSFQYPTTWRTAETFEGEQVTIINKDSTLYRGIEFILEQKETNSLRDHALSKLESIYGKQIVKQLIIEDILINNLNAIKVTNFPSGVHTQVVFTADDYLITATLIEGGEIGGGSAYTKPTAQEDAQLFDQILSNFSFARG